MLHRLWDAWVASGFRVTGKSCESIFFPALIDLRQASTKSIVLTYIGTKFEAPLTRRYLGAMYAIQIVLSCWEVRRRDGFLLAIMFPFVPLSVLCCRLALRRVDAEDHSRAVRRYYHSSAKHTATSPV